MRNLIKRFRMKKLQEQFPLRKEMEQGVCAFNKTLKEAVKYMTLEVLLYHCHPLYREDYFSKLKRDGFFDEEQIQKIAINLKKYR